MKLSRQHCIYCAPQAWEKIRRRARKAGMPVSRFGVLCCLKAAEEGRTETAAPSGHGVVIPQDQQRRLYEDMSTIWRAGNPMLAKKTKASEVRVLASDVIRFLRLTEQGEER